MDTTDDLIQACYRLERAGKMSQALQLGSQAEQQARSQGQNDLVASALAAQALVHARLGHYSRARSMAEEALACASPAALGRAEAHIILGICASETDDLDSAEAHYHLAVDLSLEISHYQTLLRALNNLACGIYYPRGQFDLVITTEREVLQIASQHGASFYQENAWIAQALVHLATGDCLSSEEALDHLERQLLPDSHLWGYYHCLKAHYHQMIGEMENAPPAYTQALTIAETIGDPGLNIEIRVGLSRYHRTQADPSAAYPWANEAVGIAYRSGYHHMEGRALIERGRVAWEMGNWKPAEMDFQTAIQRLEPLKAAFDLSHGRLMLSVLLHQAANLHIQSESEAHSEEELRQSFRLAIQEILDGGYGFLLGHEWKLVFPLMNAYLNHSDPQASELASKALAQLQRNPPPLTIFTLDRFEVRQGGRLIPGSDWRNRQAGELFRLLLVSPGRRLSHDQIIEALWPEKPANAAKAFFHQSTSALRRVLEPELPDKSPSRYLFLEEGVVTLRLPPGSLVDFETFERCVQQGDLEGALAIFKGKPFPLDIYNDWAAPIHEQLNQQYMGVLLKVADKKLQDGDPQGALEACRRIISMDSWQEQAVLIGMQACLSMKDRPGAIRLYQNLAHCLSEELGIEPLPELRQLYQSLI